MENEIETDNISSYILHFNHTDSTHELKCTTGLNDWIPPVDFSYYTIPVQ